MADPTYSYIPAPKTLPAFPKARIVDGGTGMGKGKTRRRWRDGKFILEWDYQHGTVEKYNDRGKHLGEFDKDTGHQLKPADKSRTITPTIWARKGDVMNIAYYLEWFDKETGELCGEALLPEVDEVDICNVFGLSEEEPPGDCIRVGAEQIAWLNRVVKGVDVRLSDFNYSVSACEPASPT